MNVRLKRAGAGVLCAFCVFLFSALSVPAQHIARDLTGTVTDGHHEALKGAIVQVRSEATGTIVSYITDRTGHYSFKRLESDLDYTIWATWRGHQSGVKKLSLFDNTPTKVIDLEIRPE